MRERTGMKKRSNYAGAVWGQWRFCRAERRVRSSRLYDSEIINYCFVCRRAYLAFVAVKKRRRAAPAARTRSLGESAHMPFIVITWCICRKCFEKSVYVLSRERTGRDGINPCCDPVAIPSRSEDEELSYT